MNLLSIVTTLVKLAAAVAGYMRDRQLLDAGAEQQIAREMSAMANRLEIGQLVRYKIAAMSEDELDTALRGDQ